MEFSLRPLAGNAPGGAEVREGEDAEVQFKINDSTSGNPVRGLHPAAWMDIRPAEKITEAKDCHAKIQSFLGPSLNTRPEVDLNVYYVLALNDDASISVVDPLFGYGGSKLLTTVQLKSPGQDWVLTGDRKKLYVTMPLVNQVAVIDTATWRSIRELDAGPNPIRLALQPGEKYLWVGNDGDSGDTPGAITVIDASEDKVISRIPAGPGHHEMAFTTDGGYAFVTDKAQEGTVTVIDTRQLRKSASIVVGHNPVSVAFSPLSQAAYVADGEDGTVSVIDAHSHRIRAVMKTRPGVKVIRFADQGRWGFVVNEKENMVYIFDSSTDRIVHSLEVGRSPEQISFTQTFAYIQSRETEQVTMIQLESIGRKGTVPVTEIPGGETPPGKAKSPASADVIVPAPEGSSVLIANAADKTIYYYEEGMAAPMGSFRNYGREPRAVMVIDRSLREVASGVYSTHVKLSRPGHYDVAFLLDSPRFVHCFAAEVQSNPTSKRRLQIPIQIEPLSKEKRVSVGETVRLQFKAIDPTTRQPRTGLRDLGVLILLAPGTWQKREWASAVSEGLYEVTFVVPQTGVYYVFFECPSLGARYQDLPQLILQAIQDKKPFPPAVPDP
ncbi:MAG: hypothetical protein LAO31_17645 [Acidobacteriia bacterium]|nr:hypothetical protein [Terriglobia bacterium]